MEKKKGGVGGQREVAKKVSYETRKRAVCDKRNYA